MIRHASVRTLLGAAALLAVSACADRPQSVPEVPAEEVLAQVAELDAVHEVMVPMWHEAFPARDLAGIQASISRFEPLLLDLDAARLPGILQDKQAEWDERKARLMQTFQELKSAGAEGDQEGLLTSAEAFHMSYEAMVRVVRPVVPELDAFHRYLYGVYHYYGPGYDVEKIRDQTNQMAAALPPLQAAELPPRLEHRQEDFLNLVVELGDRVAFLLISLGEPTREEVDAAIEAVHNAYQAIEAIFD